MNLYILTFNDDGSLLVNIIPKKQQVIAKTSHGWFDADHFQVVELPKFPYQNNYLEAMAIVKTQFQQWGAKEIMPLCAPVPIAPMTPFTRRREAALMLPLQFLTATPDGFLKFSETYQWMWLNEHPRRYRFPGKIGEDFELLDIIKNRLPLFDLEVIPTFALV